MWMTLLCFALLATGQMLFPHQGQAQVYSLADQYQMNFFQVNPATAGVISLDAFVVNSWQSGMKWEKFPRSQSVTFQGKLFKEKARFNKKAYLNRGKNVFGKVGVGLGLFNYSYGSIRQSGFHLDYSYHIFLGDGRLSFGLAPVFMMFDANFPANSLTFNYTGNQDDVWDPSAENQISLSFLDFNAGVHYYSETLTAGFSCIQLLNSSVAFKSKYGFPNFENPIQNPDMTRSFYAYSGYSFDLNRGGNLRVEPFVMVRYNDNATRKLRLDLSTSVHLFKNYQAGITYKLLEGGSVFLGVRYNNIRIKYQFGFPLYSLQPFSFSSHMLQIGFDPGFLVN